MQWWLPNLCWTFKTDCECNTINTAFVPKCKWCFLYCSLQHYHNPPHHHHHTHLFQTSVSGVKSTSLANTSQTTINQNSYQPTSMSMEMMVTFLRNHRMYIEALTSFRMEKMIIKKRCLWPSVWVPLCFLQCHVRQRSREKHGAKLRTRRLQLQLSIRLASVREVLHLNWR